MAAGAAETVVMHMLAPALRSLAAYDRSVGRSGGGARAALAPRTVGVDHACARRGAAALTALDAAHPQGHPKRAWVETLRLVFAGTAFEPTPAFLRELPRDETGEWALGCARVGQGDESIVTLVDGGGGRWAGAILGIRPLDGDRDTATSTADRLYALIADAAAGAGGEARATTGHPRLPRGVVVSFRLRSAFPELGVKLAALDVACRLESALETLETRAPDLVAQPKADKDTLAGNLVLVAGLGVRSDLNGRVGRVAGWRPAERRYEVALLPFREEAAERVSVKPANLEGCPPDLECARSYSEARREDVLVDDPRADRAKALLAALKANPADGLCAVCFEPTAAYDAAASPGCTLACGHVLHLGCAARFLRFDESACPCCRAPL